MSTDARLAAAIRAYRAAPTDPDAVAALRAARERAGVPHPAYWLVVPGGARGDGRLHLLAPAIHEWSGAAVHVARVLGHRDDLPTDPPALCSYGRWRSAGTSPRWTGANAPPEQVCQLCWRARDRPRADAMHAAYLRESPPPAPLAWQLAWAAARGLPYPLDGADAERVPELLAEVERELAAAGRFVVLPGSGSSIRATDGMVVLRTHGAPMGWRVVNPDAP